MASSNSVLPASRQPIGEVTRQIPPSPVEIQHEMELTAARLQQNLGTLVERVKPANVASRTADEVRQRTLTADGKPKPEIIGAAVAGAVGLVGLLVWRARR